MTPNRNYQVLSQTTSSYFSQNNLSYNRFVIKSGFMMAWVQQKVLFKFIMLLYFQYDPIVVFWWRLFITPTTWLKTCVSRPAVLWLFLQNFSCFTFTWYLIGNSVLRADGIPKNIYSAKLPQIQLRTCMFPIPEQRKNQNSSRPIFVF